MARRLSGDGGFGIIELMVAMLVLSLGIMAIVAGFSSGIVALDRASRTGTAGTLADKQMEGYRALGFGSILLTNSPSPALDGTHTTDPAWDSVNAVATGTCAASPQCAPIQTVTGPDGRSYRIDTFIVWSCPLGTLQLSGSLSGVTYPACTDSPPTVLLSKAVKEITVVVRDGADISKTYVRATSTFDEWT